MLNPREGNVTFLVPLPCTMFEFPNNRFPCGTCVIINALRMAYGPGRTIVAMLRSFLTSAVKYIDF